MSGVKEDSLSRISKQVFDHMLSVKEDTLSEISKATGLSHSSVHKVMCNFQTTGVIKITGNQFKLII